MRISTRSAALATAVCIASVAPAAFAMTSNSIYATPNPVHRGKLVRVYGTVPGCSGAITLISKAFVHTHDFAGLPALFVSVKPSGAYSGRVRVPATRKPGTYTITGRCGGGNLGITYRLKVLS